MQRLRTQEKDWLGERRGEEMMGGEGRWGPVREVVMTTGWLGQQGRRLEYRQAEAGS